MTIQGEENPRCAMCIRSARFNQGAGVWFRYCAPSGCVNPRRLCKHCGEEFSRSEGATGAYCSKGCQKAGPAGTNRWVPREVADRPERRCAWCNQLATGPTRRGLRWPYVCQACLHPIRAVVDRLKAHRVGHRRAQALAADPSCEICGVNIILPTRNAGFGKMAPLLVVDHDHGCCPADAHSCGSCVRGLICFNCNSAIGHLKDSPEAARSAATYLEKAKGASR